MAAGSRVDINLHPALTFLENTDDCLFGVLAALHFGISLGLTYREIPHRAWTGFWGRRSLGILHHLDDDDCNRLLNLTATVLKPKGRVICLDTVFHHGQNRFDRLLARNDRSEFIRRSEQFFALAEKAFESVDRGVENTRWIPSIHLLHDSRQTTSNNIDSAHIIIREVIIRSL